MATTTSNRPRNAFVTLLTTDSYLPGALVLAHSIKQSHSNKSKLLSTSDATNIPFHLVCLVSTNNVKVQSIRSLRRVFDLVIGVEPLSISGFIAHKQEQFNKLNQTTDTEGKEIIDPDKKKEINGRIRELAQRNLNLLGRPDLGERGGDALTKLHAWRLTAYDKVIFLDADTIVLNPISHLFSLSSNLAASPDVGWPDAFNSGVMVLTPSLETFDAIRTHAATNGTWDGADQGLLNEFFGGERGRGEEGEGGGWERLSFRYNATPNGGYTYAPAYQRYGSKINVAHFIGRHKPWHVPRPSSSASSSSQGTSSPTNDYNSLLSRWHSIYEEHYPRAGSGSQVDVIHSSRGVEVIERPFTVPTYEAVWDSELSQKGQGRRSHQRGNSSSRIGPGQVEDLKAMFNPGLVASAAAAEWNSKKFNAYSDDEVDNEDGIGFYYSFPLDGRVTLIPLAPLPWVDEEEEERKRVEEEKVELQRRIEEERHRQQQQNEQSNQGSSSNLNRSWSPPQVKWDPSAGPPPSGGGAADYQMRDPPDAYYQNAWDLPQTRPSDRKAVFFKPSSSSYGNQIPAQLQREHFFDNLGSHRPDPSKIKAVFPWESRKSNPSPSRVFPDEPESDIPTSRELNESHKAATRPTLDSNSSNEFSTFSSSNVVTAHHQSFDPPNHMQQGLPANLSYTNAWDEVGAIGKYADRVRRVTGGASASTTDEVGTQTKPEVSSRGSQTSKNRYRTRGSQADGGLGLDGNGGVEGEGNGGSGENSDSRDGDDESSSGEEDSEVDNSSFLTSPSSATKGKKNSTSSAKGYQRKAEAFAHHSPRSPRHLPLASSHGSGSNSNSNSEVGSPPGTATITGRARIRPEGFSRVGSGSNSDNVPTPLAGSPVNPMTDFGGRK